MVMGAWGPPAPAPRCSETDRAAARRQKAAWVAGKAPLEVRGVCGVPAARPAPWRTPQCPPGQPPSRCRQS
ncbi:hypothetical protein E2C01_061142 [Portunus trituberculatus]|uniref:Uncharacterized protein n=1 Tax=Portunus trituberculatus TaxID=210409 RepID=A0A5B7H7C8_PORTR|nr:hypothetical protein [Portunus trituberculatus]